MWCVVVRCYYVHFTYQIPPFDGRNDVEILNSVEAGVVDYDIEQLKVASNSAKILLKQMLTYKPDNRISAQKGLESPWFKFLHKKVSSLLGLKLSIQTDYKRWRHEENFEAIKWI